MSTLVHTDPDAALEPKRPDINATKFILVAGGTLPGPMAAPYLVNHKPNFSGFICRKVPVAPPPEGVYPRMPQFRVMHDVWYGTVAEMVAKFEESLTRAFRAMFILDAADGEQAARHADLQKMTWQAQEKLEAWAAKRPIRPGKVEDGIYFTTYHSSKYPNAMGMPELKAFYDQRRAMETKFGGPPCPLEPWQEEMCEDMFLAQRFELPLEKLAEIFNKYVAWKKECSSGSQQSSQEAGQGQVPSIGPRAEGPVQRPAGPEAPAAQ